MSEIRHSFAPRDTDDASPTAASFGGPPELLALRDSAEVDAWERCYIAVISDPECGATASRQEADAFIRARRDRVKPLEDHERELAWYGERVAKLRAEIERLVDVIPIGQIDAAQAVLDADDNDHSAF